MANLRGRQQRSNQIRRIKEKIGPYWKELFSPVDEKEQRILGRQIVMQYFENYYSGDYNKFIQQDISVALMELRKFFKWGPLWGLEKKYPVEKANVALIDEFTEENVKEPVAELAEG